MWQSTLKAIAEAFRNGRVAPEEIEAIGVANQRMTVVFWNRRTGEPVGRAIGWQDERTTAICERLIAKDWARIEDRTGMVIRPDVTATKIRWVMEHDKAVQKCIARGEALCGTIDSWLIWKLSGGAVHVTDYSNASLTLMLNARSLTYDAGTLNELEIPRAILPDLRMSSEIYAYTDPKAFFDTRTPIAAAAGNQQAAAFGQACFEPGMGKGTFNSGCSLTVNGGATYRPPCDGILPRGKIVMFNGSPRAGRQPPFDAMFSPVLWGLNDEVVYGLEGKADVSGTAIEWLRDGLGLIHQVGEAEGLASQVPDTQGVYFVPALLGLGGPPLFRRARGQVNALVPLGLASGTLFRRARGTVLGITRGTTRHHVVRAALEAVAYQTRDAFEVIRQESGFDPTVLRVDGSGAKSDFLMQLQADILGIPLERPLVTETAVLGAAYLAGLAVGYWQSPQEIAGNWRLDCRFEPRIPADRREELYSGWQRAIDACGRLAGRLTHCPRPRWEPCGPPAPKPSPQVIRPRASAGCAAWP